MAERQPCKSYRPAEEPHYHNHKSKPRPKKSKHKHDYVPIYIVYQGTTGRFYQIPGSRCDICGKLKYGFPKEHITTPFWYIARNSTTTFKDDYSSYIIKDIFNLRQSESEA